jgi:Family of unknown function (DUF6114)
VTRPAGAFSLLGRAWRGFRAWRRSRPFWAGIWLIIAGAELLLIPLPVRNMGIILHIGIGGISGILIGAVMILAGLLLWFQPAQHIFYSIVAVLLAIGALVASNLGGFLLGTVLGIIGGSLGFAWMPGRPERRRRRRRDRPTEEPDAGISLATGANAEADAHGDANTRADTDADAEASAGAQADVNADRNTQARAGTVRTATDPLGALPRAEHEHGTTVRAFALIPVLALLAGLASATTGLLDPSSAASPSPSACSTTTASPAPSPSDSCSPSPAASADPTPDPDPAPSASQSASSSTPGSASASSSTPGSASPSPSPAPTGTPPPFAISTAQSTLTASSVTITGFGYDGVVTVPTASGSVQMMQFSATSLDLSGVQLTVSQGGATQTTTATSLDLTGNVVLYTTELSGDLLGFPLTITPSTPIADILQVLGEAGFTQTLTQVVPLPMTNVTTLQPYTSANGMAVSALDIS